MEARLDLLAATRPEWFALSDEPDPSGLVGWAAAPDTLWVSDPLELVLRPETDRVSVAERHPGTRLPKRCPERHLQGDLTFCLGLDGLPVTDSEEAVLWWAYLGQWLVLQSVADQTGRWPPGHELDHGEAGALHRAALDLAEKLDLSDEYARAHDGLSSWITDATLHIAAPNGRPLNRRAPCPKACKTKGRRPRSILRADCSQRLDIARLVSLERGRREAVDAYWDYQRAAGLQCCGTMASCPLAPQHRPAAPARTKIPDAEPARKARRNRAGKP